MNRLGSEAKGTILFSHSLGELLIKEATIRMAAETSNQLGRGTVFFGPANNGMSPMTSQPPPPRPYTAVSYQKLKKHTLKSSIIVVRFCTTALKGENVDYRTESRTNFSSSGTQSLNRTSRKEGETI